MAAPRSGARWHEALDDAAVVWRCDELFDGWHRFVIEAAANLSAVVLVPIDFPCRSPRVFAVQTDSGRTHAVEQVTQSWVGGDALIRAVHTIKEAYGESA